MSLGVGTKLGPYEILSPAGAGGMGEVYRARDTRLDRVVAIKVLPEGHDAEQRQRLEREARAVSKLSHPNICTLYDIGQQGDLDFLVMEYMEGETLDQRLARGPLPTAQVLRVGLEIAEALDKAHRQDIIHRDLKPGNIMLTKTGAKLMDFGLAKVRKPIPIPSPLAPEQVDDRKLTAEGIVIGTLQYMAPEQFGGSDADARTDIFGLGTVLYEMATGKPAFTGKSKTSVIVSILSVDPPVISELQPMSPPALDRAVRTCLAKDPDERWQNAHDLAAELKWIAETVGSKGGMVVPATARRTRRERWPWTAMALAACALALAVLGVWWYLARTPARALHATLNPPEKTLFNSTGDSAAPPMVSSDGSRVVFGAGGRLWVSALDQGGAQPLAGTEDAIFPFWSPDSRSIGFFADGKLKTVEAGGGTPVALCDAPSPRGGTWGKEGVIVFASGVRTGLSKIAASGGPVLPVTTLDTARHTTHRWPEFLPDGQHVLYLATNHSDPKGPNTGVYLTTLDGKDNRLLLHTTGNALYSAGRLLYVRDTTLVAQEFDPSSAELKGEPKPVAENVLFDAGVWRGVFSASGEILLYQAAGSQASSQLTWLDRAGKELNVLGEKGSYLGPRLSPDGKRLAVSFGDPARDIWVFDLAGGGKTRLTFHALTAAFPVWSPDGTRIAFSAPGRNGGPPNVYETPASGSGSQRPVHDVAITEYSMDWSPDGRFLLVDHGNPGAGSVWVLEMSAESSIKAWPLVQGTFWSRGGAFSPDGRWVAYVSRESGQDEVYVAPFPGPGGKWQVSSGGGNAPRWRRDGKELYYLVGGNQLMAATVNTQGKNFEAGATKPLFRVLVGSTPAGGLGPYDVAADGQRFLFVSPADSNPAPLNLVVNWTAGLKK
jgi:Tol biopolymer transport system component/predicted Ser/Thr protein kinase